jgi:SNF2 family DNA or RNA helicase
VDGFQHVCSHVIYAEVCPIPGVFQQSIDRLHRTGQQAESVNIYILVALKTIAVKLRNDLTRRDSQANSVVRDKRTLLADLLGEEGLRGSLD